MQWIKLKIKFIGCLFLGHNMTRPILGAKAKWYCNRCGGIIDSRIEVDHVVLKDDERSP